MKHSGLSGIFSVVNLRRPTGLVLVLGLALSIFAAYATWSMVEREARLQFESRAHEITISIETRIEAYSSAIHNLQGLFAASQYVSPAEFKHFVDTLGTKHRLPGLVSVYFARARDETIARQDAAD